MSDAIKALKDVASDYLELVKLVEERNGEIKALEDELDKLKDKLGEFDDLKKLVVDLGLALEKEHMAKVDDWRNHYTTRCESCNLVIAAASWE